MPRRYGEEFPERELMSVMSDLLGIPHFTTARGSTVRKDFLDAVARALGVLSPGTLSKDEVLAACVEAATRSPMPASLFSRGGTVTNDALRAIIDGLLTNEVPGSTVSDSGSEFDPAPTIDERDRRLMNLAVRQAQDTFRSALVAAYDARCAITNYDAVESLEAAHITPYKGPASSLVNNGLLLRADVHALWDRGSLAIDESTFQILVKPHLMVTEYRTLGSGTLRLPRETAERPAVMALRNHREWCGL